jgi:hypothetical protein
MILVWKYTVFQSGFSRFYTCSRKVSTAKIPTFSILSVYENLFDWVFPEQLEIINSDRFHLIENDFQLRLK